MREMAINFSSSSEALPYAWRQLASRVGLNGGAPTGTGFEELPIDVYYCMPEDARSSKPRIVVVPCCESAWEDLLNTPHHALDWLPSNRVMPEGMHIPIGETIPVIFWAKGFEHGEKPFAERQFDDSIVIYVDIVASTFFMLSRWEETVVPVRDQYDRFPATAGVAYKQRFLDRPIVDEYAFILQAWLKALLPGWLPMSRQGDVFVTCDVDCPYDDSLSTPAKVVKRVAGDLLKRRSPGMAVRSTSQAIARLCGDWSLDPYNTFDWMMANCEKVGRRMAFYFLCQNATDMDARYKLGEKFIKQLLKTIHNRGHEIGMHGSYNSFQNPNQIMKERTALLHACKSLAIDQTIMGNRQHYLRWDATQTPDHLNAAGFEYDTSGSFADAPGFRYGTSRPFTMWSWQKKAPLKIKQRPLVVMEGSVIDDCYLGLGYIDESLDLMLTLKKRAIQFGGDFTLVWHNSSLGSEEARSMYRDLVV